MTDKRRVMFVDDEANILSGLKRTLRGLRNDWHMEFFHDPVAAVEAFARTSFDVVVTDMKMPVLDGADLLAEIKRLHPDSIRIILSGHSDPALIMKSVGQAHQFLAKPCEPDELRKTIERAYSLRALVGRDDLRKLIAGLGELPTLPAIYQEIVTCLQNPDASLNEIGDIVSKDLGMVAKMLQLVNSAFFGIANPVTTVAQAVSYLGLDTISTLVLGHGVFGQFKQRGYGGFKIEALWSHSIRCAAMAKIVAEEEDLASKALNEAFLAGMLHDVGQLVLASEMPEEYAEVRERVDRNGEFASDVELEILGATHGDVGAYLIGLWGLPDTIVEAIAYHETPSQCPTDEFGVLGAVHVANRLALNPDAIDPTDPSLQLDIAYLQKVGAVERWADWQAACQVEIEDAP